MEYISKEYLLDTIAAMIVYRNTVTDVYEMVEDAPTIDIVKCDSCVYSERDLDGTWECTKDSIVNPDDKCTRGEP